MHTAQLTWQTLEWQLLTNKINIGILSDNEIAYYKKKQNLVENLNNISLLHNNKSHKTY